jgi:hypothetical protein
MPREVSKSTGCIEDSSLMNTRRFKEPGDAQRQETRSRTQRNPTTMLRTLDLSM